MDRVIVIKGVPPKKAQDDTLIHQGDMGQNGLGQTMDISVHVQNQEMEWLLKDLYLLP